MLKSKPLNKDAHPTFIMIITCLTAFLNPFMLSSINIALPIIGKEFSMNAITLSWVTTSYLLTATILVLPFGRAGDIFGRKKIFLTGMIIQTISSVGCAVAANSELLILFRVFQGIGNAMVFATGLAIVSSVFPAGMRGKAIGINITAVYFGVSMGPFLGGFLTRHFTWRSIFYTTAFLSLIAIVLTFIKIRQEWKDAEGEKFDFAGSLLYMAVFTLLLLGFSHLPQFHSFFLIFIGMIGAALFIVLENRLKHPVLDISLFRNNRVFTLSSVAALINYSATFAIAFLISLYLQYIKGFDTYYAGLVLITQPAVMALFSSYFGRLSDRRSPQIIATAGMILTTLCLIAFIFITGDTPVWLVVLILVITGFGFALFSTPNTNAALKEITSNRYGVASATISTMRLSGQVVSMGIMLIIFSLLIGKNRITPEYYPAFLKSMKIGFISFAVLSFIGLFPSYARVRKK